MTQRLGHSYRNITLIKMIISFQKTFCLIANIIKEVGITTQKASSTHYFASLNISDLFLSARSLLHLAQFHVLCPKASSYKFNTLCNKLESNSFPSGLYHSLNCCWYFYCLLYKLYNIK